MAPPSTDVSHLVADKQKLIRDMYEESDVLAKNDSDIGHIP